MEDKDIEKKETPEEAPSLTPASGPDAAPSKSVDQEWAETLGLKIEEKRTTPPPIPPRTPPQWPQNTPPQPPQQPQQPLYPPQMPRWREPMPPTYMIWAILSTLCCCLIPGVIAIYFSAMVSSRYYEQDYEGARRASRMAEIWIIVSITLGIVTSALYVPFMLMGLG